MEARVGVEEDVRREEGGAGREKDGVRECRGGEMEREGGGKKGESDEVGEGGEAVKRGQPCGAWSTGSFRGPEA